jgi:hypothetical protein
MAGALLGGLGQGLRNVGGALRDFGKGLAGFVQDPVGSIEGLINDLDEGIRMLRKDFWGTLNNAWQNAQKNPKVFADFGINLLAIVLGGARGKGKTAPSEAPSPPLSGSVETPVHGGSVVGEASSGAGPVPAGGRMQVGPGIEPPSVPGPGPKGSNNPITAKAAEIGREAHRQLEAEGIGTWNPEQTIKLPDGTVVRKDGVGIADPSKVRIIKPDTITGRAAALERARLMKKYGYDPQIDLYDPLDPRFQPGSPTYIGPKRK